MLGLIIGLVMSLILCYILWKMFRPIIIEFIEVLKNPPRKRRYYYYDNYRYPEADEVYIYRRRMPPLDTPKEIAEVPWSRKRKKKIIIKDVE